MNPRVTEILAELRKYQAADVTDGARFQTRQTPLMSELLMILAEEQSAAATKMEQYTQRLVVQTGRLVAFTRGLYWFTIVLLGVGIVQIVVSLRHP